MKSFISAFLIICLILSPVYAEIDGDCFAAYKALKRIEAMMESGVVWADYSKAVTEATLEVNLIRPNKAEKFKNILKYYQIAKDLWNADLKLKLVTARPAPKIPKDRLSSVEKALLLEQVEDNMKKFSKVFGATHKILKEVDKLFPSNDLAKNFRIEFSKQLLWNKASQLLKEYQAK